MRRPLTLSIILIGILSWSSAPAAALPGDPDATYGGDGKILASIGPYYDYAFDATIQADGKIVVVGKAYVGSPQDDNVALARFTTAGALDSTFSGDGRVIVNASPVISPGLAPDRATAVVIQDDGKIVVAGSARYDGNTRYDDFLLMRFTAGGLVDTTFGSDSNGKVLVDVGANDQLADLAIGPGGTLVAVGSTSGLTTDVAVLRFDADGHPDASFGGGDGIVLADGGNGASGSGVAVQGDGTVVVSGSTQAPFQDPDTAVFRFEPDGDPDATFGGGDGVVIQALDPTDVDFGKGVTLVGGQPLVVGTFGGELFAMKLEADGDPDPTFGGGDGVTTASFAFGVWGAGGVVVQPNGAILAVGGTDYAGDDNLAIARWEADGDPDATFGGGDGTSVVDFVHGLEAGAAAGIVRQADGKVVVVGTVDALLGGLNSWYAFALARIKTSVPAYRPDALIKGKFRASFKGDDIYSATAAQQAIALTALRGSTSSFPIRFENDGSHSDSYRLDGCGSSGPFTVRYYRGSTRITRPVANGTYVLSGMDPNEEVTIVLKITIGGHAEVGKVKGCLVSASSIGAPTVRDAVKAKVKASV